MMRWTLGLVLLWTTSATAAPLTYREAVEAALQSNPSLASARFATEQAEARVMGANGVFDPTLTLGSNISTGPDRGFFQGNPYSADTFRFGADARLSGATPTGTSYSLSGYLDRSNNSFTTRIAGVPFSSTQDSLGYGATLSVTQEVLRGYRMAYNLRSVQTARSSLTVAELAEARTVHDTVAQAATAYWTWAHQVELDRIARESVDLAEEALRVGELRVAAGELAAVERTRLQAARIQAEANALDARNASADALDGLLLVMGRDPGTRFEPATLVGEVPALALDAEQAIATAVEGNLELAVARAQLDQAELDHELARHATLPSLSVTVAPSVKFQSDQPLDLEDPNTEVGVVGFPGVSASTGFSMPLGNRAARGERDRTAAAQHSERVRVEELERSIRQQVASQVRKLNSARQRVELADANQRLAEQSLASDEALAAAGRAIQRDVLESRNVLEQAKVDAAKARADYRLAVVELQKLQGSVAVE